MSQYIIRFAEIALKGKNRNQFIKKLQKNISCKLKDINHSIITSHSQLFLIIQPAKQNTKNQINQALSTTFGISWFAQTVTCPTNIDSLARTGLQIIKQYKFKSFALKVNRSDKTLNITSQEIATKIGQIIKDKTKTQVNLNNPDFTLFIDLNLPQSYLYAEKFSGPGGLPVGSSGKLLCLLSGGFDSALASYLLAKRGSAIDYLHFHIFPDNQKIINTKIPQIVNTLYPFTLSKNIYLASYTPFQLEMLNQKNTRQELIVFRRLMIKVASLLAQKNNYQAIILGDSLGQVASQTIENIVAVDQITNLSVFRPLIGFDKQEIINLIKQINLYEIINQPYKDCCSIVSTHPATTANLKKINQLEKQININRVAQKIFEQTKISLL